MLKRFAVVDTETIGIENPLVYDFAVSIVDRNGHVYEDYNVLIGDVITDASLMKDAFYHKKVYTHYIPMLSAGLVKLAHWDTAIAKFRSMLAIHNVGAVCAYNMNFDVGAMWKTHLRFGNDKNNLTGGEYQRLCLWRFVVDAILSRPKYQKIATELGWFKSSTGNVITNAEKAYAYISGEWGFCEDHTAMSDVRIETEILLACLKQKGKIPYDVLKTNPWKDAQ